MRNRAPRRLLAPVCRSRLQPFVRDPDRHLSLIRLDHDDERQHPAIDHARDQREHDKQFEKGGHPIRIFADSVYPVPPAVSKAI